MKRQRQAEAYVKTRRASKAATALPPGLVSVPCVAWIWTEVMPSFLGLESSLPDGSCVRYKLGGSTICGKRNHAVEEMLDEPTFQWLFFVDSDMTLPKGALQRLLSHKADVVGGLCCIREEPHFFVAGHVVQYGQSDDALRPTDNPDFMVRSLQPSAIDTGAVPVDVLGNAVMLIHRRVLESMDPPWFVANERRPETDGQNEDWNFCLRAKDRGFTIVCDTSIACGHVGTTNITPGYAKRWWLANGFEWAEENPDWS